MVLIEKLLLSDNNQKLNKYISNKTQEGGILYV